MGALRQRLVRNTLFNVGAHLWTLLLGFVLTPILIHHVGLGAYGLYVLVGSILAWFWLLDFEMSAAAMRNLSAYGAREEWGRFSDCLSTLLTVRVATGLAVAGGATLAAGPAGRWIFPEDAPQAAWVLRLMGWNWAVTNLASALNAALAARQRMDLPTRAGLALSIPGAGASLGALLLGWGMPGYLAVNLGLSAVYLGIVAILLGRVAPRARVALGRVSPTELKRLAGFSGRQAINRLADTFLGSADRLALGGQMAAVSLYQLGAVLIGRIRELVALTVSASLPAAADLFGRDDWKGLEELLNRGTKYLVALGLPLTLFAALFAEEILTLWLGSSPPESALVLRILAGGYFLNVIAAMSAAVGAATNRLYVQVRASVGAIAAALAVYLGEGRHHDITGLSASVSAGFAVLGAGQLAGLARALRARLTFSSRTALVKPAAAAFLAVLAGVPAKAFSGWTGWAQSRPNAGLLLGFTAIAVATAFAGATRLLGWADEKDLNLIRAALRRPPGVRDEGSASAPQ